MIGGRARQTFFGWYKSISPRISETWKVPNRPSINLASSNDISSQSLPTTTDEAVKLISTIVTTTSIASTSMSTTAIDIEYSRFELRIFRQVLSDKLLKDSVLNVNCFSNVNCHREDIILIRLFKREEYKSLNERNQNLNQGPFFERSWCGQFMNLVKSSVSSENQPMKIPVRNDCR